MPLLWHPIERDPLWRREMRERWRRPITLFFLTLYAVGVSGIAYSLYRSIVPAGAVELGAQSHGIGHRLFMALLQIQILLWIPIAFLLGAPTIAAERERHALTEYLLAGLQTRQIVRAKFAALATYILVMCAIPLPVVALCFPLGGVEPVEFVAGFLLEVTAAIACGSLGILISANNKRVPPAMQNAVFLSLVFLIITSLTLPGILQVPVVVWFVVVGFLCLGIGSLVAGCDKALTIVAHNLEMEDPDYQASPFSFSPAPPPLSDRPQKSSLTPTLIAPEGETEEGAETESSLDRWIEQVAAQSAVAQREVRVGLRAARRRTEFSPPPPYRYSLGVWALAGLCGAALIALTGMLVWLYLGLVAMTLLTVIAATLEASAAFTREREQKMLTQLRVCPLSPGEVVAGKIGAMLLLVIRSWGSPLLALFLAGLAQGIILGVLTASFVVLTVLFATVLATLLSLICRRTSVAATTALGILCVVFVLLPLSPGPLVYFFPVLKGPLTSFPLGPLWIEPMSLFSWSSVSFPMTSLSPVAALFRLVCSLGVANALLIIATTGLWARATPDDGEIKKHFWERDFSRSWH